MSTWRDAPFLHYPNSSYLDSLSDNTDPYTIYYGQAAIVSEQKVLAYGIINILGIVSLLVLVLTILFSGSNFWRRFKRRIRDLIYSKETKARFRMSTISTTSSTMTWNQRKALSQTPQNQDPIRRIQRDPCLINSFIVIILVNLLNLLYWFANKGNISTREIMYLPHAGLCRAQAILQAGSQAAQMTVVLSVVLRLWLKTITLTKPHFDRFRGRATLIFLLALPYLFVIGFIPRMVILTANDKIPVLIPTPFYCSLLDLGIRRSYQILTGVIAILTLIMELWVILLILQHFRQTSRTTNLANSSHGLDFRPKTIRLLNTSFYIRVSLFVFWTMGMIATTLYQAFDKTITDPNSDFMFASMGLIGFICFATQSDILRAWNIPASWEEWKFLLSKEKKVEKVIVRIPEIPRSKGDDSNPKPRPQRLVQRVDERISPDMQLDLGDFLGHHPSEFDIPSTFRRPGDVESGIGMGGEDESYEFEEKGVHQEHLDVEGSAMDGPSFPSSGMVITLQGSIQDQDQSIVLGLDRNGVRSDVGHIV
ncbi:hypothetical protein I302_100279 [Kwoniella bestiolae CBS 10118]|uniref:Uncharacterized protein n=1 Tax=Kwoniella bestiolae CBS 10118 TaxID=1296100 RepID=A0A1B9G4L6_9TREE|nr:hypothetical protein I302_03651 [Kwoniella bestiolae CBS 10118]OCF25974.1 hypothetical protein I302_03651 [Kwoniella bestiolae CBS 10118]